MQYIPKRIYVGFRLDDFKSQDKNPSYETYIGYSELNQRKFHKKVDIDNWRDKNIPPLEFENTPTEGFILDKKVGDTKTQKAWINVIDPRGFVFKISIDNLLCILDSTTCLPLKKLQGKFVFFFDNGNLVLLSCESADYVKLIQHSTKLETKKITSKNATKNTVYITRTGDKMLYLGRFNTYSYGYRYQGKFYKDLKDIKGIPHQPLNPLKKPHVYESIPYSTIEETIKHYNIIDRCIPYKTGQHFWFAYKSGSSYEFDFRHTKTFPNYLVEESCKYEDSFDLPYIQEKMLNHPLLHPIAKTEWKDLPYDKFLDSLNSGRSRFFSDTLSYRSDKELNSLITDPICYNTLDIFYNKLLKEYIISSFYFESSYDLDDFYKNLHDPELIYKHIHPKYFETTLDNGHICSRYFYDGILYSYYYDLSL